MKRRDFLLGTGLGAAALTAGDAFRPGKARAEDKPSFNWKMVTSWPSRFPIFQESAERFARRVEELASGRIRIKVFSAGGLAPALGVFDAVSTGKAEIGCSFSYFWTEKVPAARWFASVPFGFNAQQMNTWLYGGDGLALWEKAYEPFNLVPRPLGNTGGRMGGWFNRRITKISDIRGLRMRILGLGGQILSRAGGHPVTMSGGDIFTALRDGKIDASDWIGPYHDLQLGFNNVAKYYYYPGWQDPSTCIEAIFNKQVYDDLPEDIRFILESAARETSLMCLSEFEAKNSAALQELVQKHNVQLAGFPEDVLEELKTIAEQVIDETAAANPLAEEVNNSYKNYKASFAMWENVVLKPLADIPGLAEARKSS